MGAQLTPSGKKKKGEETVTVMLMKRGSQALPVHTKREGKAFPGEKKHTVLLGKRNRGKKKGGPVRLTSPPHPR